MTGILAAAATDMAGLYDSLPGYFMARLEPVLRSLLDAATASGEIRTGIAPPDLLHAVADLCLPAPGETVDYSRRMVALEMDSHP